jgi:hypothetical protein
MLDQLKGGAGSNEETKKQIEALEKMAREM